MFKWFKRVSYHEYTLTLKYGIGDSWGIVFSKEFNGSGLTKLECRHKINATKEENKQINIGGKEFVIKGTTIKYNTIYTKCGIRDSFSDRKWQYRDDELSQFASDDPDREYPFEVGFEHGYQYAKHEVCQWLQLAYILGWGILAIVVGYVIVYL